MDEGEVSFCEFVEASEDPSVVFEIAEHDLDLVAFFIKEPIGVALDRSDRMGRDDGFGIFGLHGVEDGIAVIGAIGEHGFGFDLVDQAERPWRIAGLACGYLEAKRIAEGVTGCVHLA
ncbi:MAG: hypothetical protein OEU92_10720 [Alphaproteobacteria bacterium]|nr:hypothetical protein [Alphaproteobacteria bacterium]